MSRRARVQHPSQDVRGIDIPCVEMKMVERVFSFADKAIHGPALMPQQVGVAVSGGITMLTAGVEGEATLDFLREVEEVAGDQSSADLYHWSAMEFGEHWLQRLSLVLARGQGDLVLEAVKTARKNHRGRDGGRGASAEWSQTDCQPCVSLA